MKMIDRETKELAKKIFDNIDNSQDLSISVDVNSYTLSTTIKKDRMVEVSDLPDAFFSSWIKSNNILLDKISVDVDGSNFDIPMMNSKRNPLVVDEWVSCFIPSDFGLMAEMEPEVETQPKKKKIKKKKQYRTRSGLPVEIITTKHDHPDYRYSVQYKVDGVFYLCNKYGNYLVIDLNEHPLDLIEVTIDSLELDDVIEVELFHLGKAIKHANGQGGFFNKGQSSETNDSTTPLNKLNQLSGDMIKSWKFISKFKQEENK